MADKIELSNAAYYTEGLKGPFRYAGENVHNVMAPLGQGIERAMYGFPLIGPMLAVLAKGLLSVAEGAVGMGLFAVGKPLGMVWDMIPWNMDSTEMAEDEPEMQPAREPENPVREPEQAEKGAAQAEAEPRRDLVQEPEKNPVQEILQGPAGEQQLPGKNDVKKEDAPHRELQVREGKNIFKMSPQDVYHPGEDEPQLQKAVEVMGQAQKKVSEVHGTLEECRSNRTKDWKKQIQYEDLAGELFTQIMDHDMRRGRKYLGEEGPMEKYLLRRADDRVTMEQLLKPSDAEKARIAAALRELSLEQLLGVTEGMNNTEFRKFRNAVGADIAQSRKPEADQIQKELGINPGEAQKKDKRKALELEELQMPQRSQSMSIY